LSGFYAEVIIMSMEFFLLLSLFIFYNVFINRYATLELVSGKVIIPGLAISLINRYIFYREEICKSYVEEFDHWPVEKNRKGTIIVIVSVAIVASMLIFSFYLMSLVDWSKYR
jgi:hypothetical protein